MNDQRNLILAIVLSIVILLGFQFLYEMPRVKQQQAEQGRQQTTSANVAASAPGAGVGAGVTAPQAGGVVPPRDRAEAIGEQMRMGARLRIDTPRLHGSINTVGGRLDDLTLADYRETPDSRSAEIVLLSPAGTTHPYYSEFGWVPEDRAIPAPGPESQWVATSTGDLTPTHPVTLAWDNGQGLVFEKTISVDGDYMFTIVQRVRNNSGRSVTMLPYSLVSRHGTPQTSGYYILHEGPLGVLNGTLKEVKYDDLHKDTTQDVRSTGGWIGITDKYWLVTLVPEQKQAVTARFLGTQRDGQRRYQVDMLGESRTVAPGGVEENTMHLFAGAKQVRLLDAYGDALGISKFDLAIDFGWFYFLTKPFFYALDLLARFLGNFGLSILIFTVLVKAAFYPMADKSYRAMSKMKALQPQMMTIRERFADDPQRMNQEIMALYKRENANPLSGCLPIIVQIPVFFALYKVLFVTIEMRHAPFYGWIHDLSAPDPTSLFNLFGLLPFAPPDFLMIGVWPLIMGVTMFLQQKLNPAPADPIQAKIFTFLPILFTFMLAQFPAGLVIYWAWNNLLSIAQQWFIMRQMGVKV